MAFDGCDSLDTNLNALKSNGGSHLFEKITAELADEYIILALFQRVTKFLDSKVPLTVKVIEKALVSVQPKIKELQLKTKVRLASDIAVYVRIPLATF
ncbi:ribose-5-phosphate isomerase A [Ligilactobacillus pobuzihii]|uniref:ribose-5-phosphate isomerase A n=1 Tax=Ligilactobacillus pobuzihii TaxID=449659 RepID=UPI001F49BCA8|nr:ribose-5-phosphate isomerase A [Ligilactobacillus pobuzihii]